MQCENNMCIYNKDTECLLSSVNLDDYGQCTDMINVEIEDEILEPRKNEMRETLRKDEINLFG